ncbi:hypothetical protein CSUI_006350 [Cystoisospora suis]|uniref:Transmembrane protein n=1 Tax=Cystoisospora suis TaxID=483139 RepID=A0A2C6KS37_9APIC|nr:hypothetical protein CSUI_006350 [Cystoisospora suis]
MTRFLISAAWGLWFFLSFRYFVHAESNLRRTSDEKISENSSGVEDAQVGAVPPSGAQDFKDEDAQERQQAILQGKAHQKHPAAGQRRSSFSFDSFRKRSGVGRPKLLLTVSVVLVGLVLLFSLRQLGELLWKCLAERDGVSKLYDGSTPRSLSRSTNTSDDLECGRLLADLNDGGFGRVSGLRRPALGDVLRRLVRHRRQVLFAMIVVISVLAILFLPSLSHWWWRQQPGISPPEERPTPKRVVGYRSFSATGQTKDVWSIGKKWVTRDGTVDGVDHPVSVFYRGVEYRIYFSEELERVLKEEGTLEAVRDALSSGPQLEYPRLTDALVWGALSGTPSVVVYSSRDEVENPDVMRAPYDAYLPRGIFGIHVGYGQPEENAEEAYSHLRQIFETLSILIHEEMRNEGA